MNQPLVIYHANCHDGFCAAWLFKQAFPDAEFHAAQYGEPPPDVAGRQVYVVDFSYKRPVMLELIAATRGRIVVLDHHKTAQAELAGIAAECRTDALDAPPVVTFDMDRSGARLALEFLHGDDVGCWLVDYVEDRDLWRWRLPESRLINAALRSYPLDFATWDQLSLRDPTSLVPEGVAIARREAQIVADHVRNAREVEMDGHRVLAVNATALFSEIAGELARDRPFGACYFDRADGKRQWSLRSRADGVDVSEIAGAHGGGGHRNAAGFEAAAGPPWP